jgi:hypothetical protein
MKKFLIRLALVVALWLFAGIPLLAQNQNVTVQYGIQINGQPIVQFSPTSLTFGNQNINTTSASQAITMTNAGTATLTITSLAASSQYAETDNCVGALVANGTCTINVTFTPTVASVVSGTITVTDNAPTGNPNTVSLSGTGVSPNVTVPVDAYMNFDLATPSAPGTQLTSPILLNGTAGSVLSGWGSSGTAANMQVGLHNPKCFLKNTLTVGGVTYSPGMTSQSFKLITTNNNTFWTGNYNSSGHAKIVSSGCLTIPTNVTGGPMDIDNIQDAGGFVQWLQINTGATTMDVEVSPSPVTANINVNAGESYHFTMLDDEVNGKACFAVYQWNYPYTQQGPIGTGPGGSQCHTQTTSTAITAVRLGNAEAGTCSGCSLSFENLIFDSTNALFPVVPTYSALPAPIIPPSRSIDWTKAGVTGGIPTRTNVCTTLGTAGQLPVFVQAVTAAQIISAINSCGQNNVVLLNPGTYNLTAQLTITNIANVTLRGSGADQTILVGSGIGTTCGTGLPVIICVRATDGNYSGGPTNTASWTAGYLPGTTTITLSAVPNLVVGHMIILDQLDDTNFGCDSGKVLVSDITTVCGHGSPVSPGINGPYDGDGSGGGNRPQRGQMQIVKVTQCDGNSTIGHACSSGTNIGISPGLYMSTWNWSPGNNLPQAWWATAPSHGVGLEDFTVDGSNNGANTDGCSGGVNVAFYNAYDSWAYGLRSIDSVKAHIESNWSAHITRRANYLYLTQNAGSTGGTSGNPTGCAYGMEDFASSDNLTENNIMQAVATPHIFNGPCSGCVDSYNFSILDLYLGTPLYSSNAHSDHGYTDMALMEGNIGNVVNADNTHTTRNLETFFRNYWTGPSIGWQSSTDVSTTVRAIATGTFALTTQNNSPFVINSFNRFFNVIGNILGTPGTNTTYENSGSAPVFDIGNGNASYGTANDPNVLATTMIWGNCDSANGFANCRFVNSEVPSSLSNQGQSFLASFIPVNHTLPASLYLTAKPSWFGTVPFPPIGPDVTGGNVSGVNGTVNMIPAEVCYLNIMGGPANGVGPVLTYSRTACGF